MQNKLSKTIHRAKTIYQEHREGIVFYLLFKVALFWIFVLGVHFLKEKFLGQEKFLYDTNIIKVINPDDIFLVIIISLFWLSSFILERNFLIFYFVNKFKKRKITQHLFWKEFVLTQLNQLKLFLIEALSIFFYFIIIAGAVYLSFYFFGLHILFYLGVILGIGLFGYLLLTRFIQFLFIMYCFFDNPKQKNIFIYFSRQSSKTFRKKSFILLGQNLLFFLALTGFGLGLLWLISGLIDFINNLNVAVYLAVVIVLVQVVLFFAFNLLMYIFIFYRFTEFFYKRKFNNDSSSKKKTNSYEKMLKIIGMLVFIVVTITFVVYFSQTVLDTLNREYQSKVVFAHRGFSEQAVQNSMESFRQAVGVSDFIELDVQITKDNKVIVFHDSNFKNLTGQVGIVSQRNYSEIKNYHIRERKKKRNQEQVAKIPLLEDVLRELAGKNIHFAIEIKNTDKIKTDKLIERVAELMKKYKIDNTSAVISLNYEVLQKIHQINPNISRGLILTYSINNLSKFDVDFYVANSLIGSQKLIRQAHKLGRPIYFWNFEFLTSDFEKEYVLGADGFVVNDPVLAKQDILKYKNMSLVKKIKIIFKYFLK